MIPLIAPWKAEEKAKASFSLEQVLPFYSDGQLLGITAGSSGSLSWKCSLKNKTTSVQTRSKALLEVEYARFEV